MDRHGTTGAAAADEERTFLGFIGSRFKNAIEDREIKKSIDSLIKAGASNDELFKAGVLPQNYFERLKHEGELVKIPLSK
ncbi:hypothetical protein L917_11652 [Phytophthora nicotianae]|uniref:Uncharacterized protein n=2 Tax=Phytophthora nicotianae TaxID=4792 RepID=W2KXU2_PHYNI|nr:hypothetical protein L917_11652 [Phytophthora nicotianae]ETO71402.1 hypothetical protein F444_12260 [Phytophthora nicotianae P1976]